MTIFHIVCFIKLGSFFFPRIGIGAKKGLSVSTNSLSCGINLKVSCSSRLSLKVIIPLAEKKAFNESNCFSEVQRSRKTMHQDFYIIILEH